MNQKIFLNGSDDIDQFEINLLQLENEGLKKELEFLELVKSETDKREELFYKTLSDITGQKIDPNDDLVKIPMKAFLEAIDKVHGALGSLIQPSHSYLKYSLLKKRKELREIAHNGNTKLDVILRGCATRDLEIIREYTSENTKRAFDGDLLYWQAWLSAIGFNFTDPISENIVKAFIIQHIEGMDPDVDKILVDQGYKSSLGCHALETVKRRIIHLSVCLDLDKHPNYCRTKEVKMLLGRLSKKYGSNRAKKAITRDILDDLLETCGNSLIDTRDRAILLFSWSSGGRRRNEVVSAVIENLTELSDGDYLYRLEKTKTDQESKGTDVPVKGRAAKALKDWLNCFEDRSGPIFRSITKSGLIQSKALSGIDVNRIVKKRAKKAGYDETKFGAHSLRSGFVTEGGRKGKPLGDIMAMTTHKDVATTMKYYQSGAIINNQASNLAD